MTMIQGPPELVAMRLALDQQLAALREANNVVQQQIARRTGYSRSSVAKAEADRQLLTRDFWAKADRFLGADGDLLASYEQVRQAKEQYEANAREAQLAQAYAEAQARAEELRAAGLPDEQNGMGPSGQEPAVSSGYRCRWGAGCQSGRAAVVPGPAQYAIVPGGARSMESAAQGTAPNFSPGMGQYYRGTSGTSSVTRLGVYHHCRFAIT
ncbi:MAG: helix-turn-helix domain-containing protein [Pseudonocardiaceae bacterium]